MDEEDFELYKTQILDRLSHHILQMAIEKYWTEKRRVLEPIRNSEFNSSLLEYGDIASTLDKRKDDIISQYILDFIWRLTEAFRHPQTKQANSTHTKLDGHVCDSLHYMTSTPEEPV